MTNCQITKHTVIGKILQNLPKDKGFSENGKTSNKLEIQEFTNYINGEVFSGRYGKIVDYKTEYSEPSKMLEFSKEQFLEDFKTKVVPRNVEISSPSALISLKKQIKAVNNRLKDSGRHYQYFNEGSPRKIGENKIVQDIGFRVFSDNVNRNRTPEFSLIYDIDDNVIRKMSRDKKVLNFLEQFTNFDPVTGQYYLFENEFQTVQDVLDFGFNELENKIVNWEEISEIALKEQDNKGFRLDSVYNNQVHYSLKAIDILESDKAKQVFNKGEKNSWSLDKILTELQIPKEQKQLVLDLDKTNREEIITDLLANYSYTIEINTTKQQLPVDDQTRYYQDGDKYYSDDPYDGKQEISFEEYERFRPKLTSNSSYYSNVTVPGGTNYTENEIATPAITPSIKGHAQFATDKGIGWFRSDDKVKDTNDSKRLAEELQEAIDLGEVDSGMPTGGRWLKEYNSLPVEKTRRILEVQSDLFQKGRDKKELTYSFHNTQENLENENSPISVFDYSSQEEYEKALKEYNRTGGKTTNKENQFLQLLNKDNNWVTFFIKSIIQDSAKKGYEKVLFPSGNTASKVEGHTTLEEFKSEKEDRITSIGNELIKDFIQKNNLKEISPAVKINYKGQYDRINNLKKKYPELKGNIIGTINEKEEINIVTTREKLREELTTNNNEINQIKAELERVETEGFSALRPIYNFYENVVTNILNKQYGKDNVKVITDEYGNTWNEIEIKPTFSSKIRLNSPHNYNTPDNTEIQAGDNYGLIVAQKIKALEKVENELIKVNVQIQAKTSSELEKRKNTLISAKLKLQEQLDYLRDKQEKLMYHAIREDIAEIMEVLNSDDFHDIERVADTIEFYKMLDFTNNPEINSELRQLEKAYEDLSRNKIVSFLENSEYVQQVLDNLNNDDAALEKFGKEINRVTGKREKATVSDLLEVNDDIGTFDEKFLGVITSNTGDSIIPSLLLKTFMEKLNSNQNNVISLINRQNNFNKANPNIDKEPLKEKDEKGNYTGRIVSVFSDTWDKALRYKDDLKKTFWESPDANTRQQAYENIFNWHKNNSDIIDFTKLLVFRDMFETLPEFTDHFKYSEEEMLSYENELKDKLGPEYKTVISKLKRKLEDYNRFLRENESLDKESEEYKKFESKRLSMDIWNFLEMFQNNDKSKMINKEGLDFQNYFVDFSNDFFIPKKSVNTIITDFKTGEKIKTEYDSNYYSKDFETVKNDEKLSELWNIYKEMSDYINATYSISANSKIVPPKMQQVYLDKVLGSIQGLASGNIKNFFKTMTAESFKTWASIFSDSESRGHSDERVQSNYVNSFENDIKKLTKTYVWQGMSQEAAKEKATREILKSYSDDIDMSFAATLMSAAVHNTRMELAPFAEMALDVYKNLGINNNNKDATRDKGIAKMKSFVSKTFLNKNTKDTFVGEKVSRLAKENIKLSNVFLHSIVLNAKNKVPSLRGAGKVYSDQEKILLKSLRELSKNKAEGEVSKLTEIINGKFFGFEKKNIAEKGKEPIYSYRKLNEEGEVIQQLTKEQFDEVFDEYLIEKIKTLGEGFNLTSVFNGLMGIKIIQGLGLNISSGIFNRMEGVITTSFMDSMGEYWKPGSNRKSERFLAFANTLNSLDKIVPLPGSTTNNLKAFREIVFRLGGFQDRSQEAEKIAKNRNETLDRFKNIIFAWSVDKPEFKNQGQTALNVMQDTYITDKNGVIHPFFNGNTGEFSMFEFKDNGLEIRKDENGESLFNENIEEFFESNIMSEMSTRIQFTIAKVNGNYMEHDIRRAQEVLLLKAATMFKTWFFEHWQQRYQAGQKEGEFNINPATGKQVQAGRYIAGLEGSPYTTLLHITGMHGIKLGGFMALMPFLGIVPVAVTGVVGAAMASVLSKNVNKKDIKADTSRILHSLEYLKAVLIESLNFPSTVFQAIPGVNRLKINTIDNKVDFLNSFKNSKGLTEHQKNSLRTMTMEMAVQINMLAMKLLLAAFLYEEDDDDNERQKRVYNWMQNNLTRLSGTLTSFSSPKDIGEDMFRIGLLKDLIKVSDALGKFQKGEIGEGSTELAMQFLPVPKSILKKENGENLFMSSPFESRYNYDRNSFIGDGNFKWLDDFARNKATDGEYGAGKNVSELKEEEREKIKQKYSDAGLNPSSDNIKKAIDNEMETIFNNRNKKKGREEFKDLENDLYTGKNKNDAQSLNKLRNKLKEEGLTPSEIDKIIEIRKK